MSAIGQDDMRNLLDMAAAWAAGSEDVGPGDVECLRRAAAVLGVDPALVTPGELRANYPHKPEPKIVMRSTARVKMTLRPGDVWRDPDGVACGLAEMYRHVEEGACGVRRCDKPWGDPVHLPITEVE